MSAKEPTARRARAEGVVHMRGETRRLIDAGELPKGSVFEVARIAGIQGAKSTSQLIPLCHPLGLEKVAVQFEWLTPPEAAEARLRIESEVKVTAKTGVEMEALTAVSLAALAVYDMAKAVDPGMTIGGVSLLEKRGGKSTA